MDILVGEGFWTIDRWNRCGMRSKPGSVGLSGGRIRTALKVKSVEYMVKEYNVSYQL